MLEEETSVAAPLDEVTEQESTPTVSPDAVAIAYIKDECRRFVRGMVTRLRAEELEEWVKNKDIYPYFVSESRKFEAELRACGYDVDALPPTKSISS